jgi:DNA-binding NarL/FixJ family response regulator
MKDPQIVGPRLRLLLVDDEAVIRRGLRMWLDLEADFDVVGEASTGAQAIVLAGALRPDVVLMDVEMPEMDGVTATAALRAAVPHVRVVLLSQHADAPTRTRALAAGAAGCVSKGTGDTELLETLRALGARRPSRRNGLTDSAAGV